MEILKGVEPVEASDVDGLMLLAIDVGNTQTLAGVYHGDELLHEWRISTERAATADELAADHDQILRLRGGSLGALDEMVVARWCRRSRPSTGRCRSSTWARRS